MIELYPQEITRVFLNLFANGFSCGHQAEGNGHANGVCADHERRDKKPGRSKVEIRIRDNGIGIPDV